MKDSYFKACEENNLSLVRELLSKGADVNWRGDADGYSVLHIATEKNYEEFSRRMARSLVGGGCFLC